ncbi:hypothetical protein NDU88_005945 [Pleurodeles waltl]|uniref:Uncharacterized protein n=1 Tax=Pleurodeles waltl TaxID=8319 RepID=A0AAV7MZG9_PLEWA|nr:hypothetical protein NDU88_005945 [Pleurodeles waltl]
MADERVQRVLQLLQLLQEPGCMDLICGGALKTLSPARKVSGGVAAAMWACLPHGGLRVRESRRRQERVEATQAGITWLSDPGGREYGAASSIASPEEYSTQTFQAWTLPGGRVTVGFVCPPASQFPGSSILAHQEARGYGGLVAALDQCHWTRSRGSG